MGKITRFQKWITTNICLRPINSVEKIFLEDEDVKSEKY